MDSLQTLKNLGLDLEVPIKPLISFDQSADVQEHSNLLTLPTEILDLIVNYALEDYEDLTKPYPFETCYRRPRHLAPRRTDTSLLRTCQAIYTTYWYLPWTLATHTFYLTQAGRQPQKTASVNAMAQAFHLIEYLHPTAPLRRKQVANVQIFPQLCMLEGGKELNTILCIPFFHPRTITITIRHTDWWWWEGDEPMRFLQTAFVRNCRFPESTTCLNLELESLERRKTQVNWMADRIARDWHFTRTDDVHLVAEPGKAILNPELWKGCATWQNRRWVRDEDDTEPNVLKYYILTVAFRPVRPQDDVEGYEWRNKRTIPDGLCCDSSVADKTKIRSSPHKSLGARDMREAGVTANTKASEAVKLVFRYRRGLRRGACGSLN